MKFNDGYENQCVDPQLHLVISSFVSLYECYWLQMGVKKKHNGFIKCYKI